MNGRSIDQGAFCRYVAEAFDRLDDLPYLAAHPLAQLLAGADQRAAALGVRRSLLGAVEALRPPEGTPAASPSWRRWRVMGLRYVEGLTTRQIARRIQISERQTQRDHLAGVEAVASILWAELRRSAAVGGRGDQPEPGGETVRPNGGERQLPEDLETALVRASSSSPETATDVVQVLEGVLGTIRGAMEARHAGFHAAFPDDLPRIAVDPVALRQILLCLLSAALHGGPSPQVTVSVASVGDRLQVVVAGHCSERRAASGEVVPGEVDALVAAARRFAELQGGSVEVTAPPDWGMRALLTLPATRAVTVLVIDDNPDVGELFRSYLAGTRYRLVQARTPPTALKLARELHPDVITLDVLMPSQDGWQILQQLRADPASRGVPVVVCSIVPERPLAMSLGADGFLAKPVTPRSLLAALEGCQAGLVARRGSPACTQSPRPRSDPLPD